MAPSHADRNLLFDILALQMDFISREALIAAMHAWVQDKTWRLVQVLHCPTSFATDCDGKRLTGCEPI